MIQAINLDDITYAGSEVIAVLKSGAPADSTDPDDYDFNAMLAPGAVLKEAEPRGDCNGFPGPTFMSVGYVARCFGADSFTSLAPKHRRRNLSHVTTLE